MMLIVFNVKIMQSKLTLKSKWIEIYKRYSTTTIIIINKNDSILKI